MDFNDPRNKRARQRIYTAIEKLDREGVIATKPVNLRYLDEYLACYVQALADYLLATLPALNQCALEERIVLELEGRAALLERRLEAAVAGEPEMPQ